MGIITWIVVGLIAGALAKWIMPGKDPGGIFITMLIGIGGGVLGGYLSSALGFGGLNGFSIQSIVLATIGSVILLYAYKKLRR